MTVGQKTIQWTALGIVLVTGAFVGFFVWKTFLDYVPHLYPLEFTHAQWIMVQTESPQGYFRKDLYIPEAGQQAWIMVAATDSYVLYLNGKRVDTQGFPLLNVSGIYDIGRYLQPGKNVLGVKVTRGTFPGPARMVMEGTYLDQTGRSRPIVSDTSWKAMSHEASQDSGALLWYGQAFDADAWPSAQVSGVPSRAEVAPAKMHPYLFALPPQGKWIGHADPRTRAALFSQTFEVTQKVQGAWVRLAAADRYDLTVNGILVASAGLSGMTLDMYDIAPFLQRGANTIRVQVVGWQSAPPRLLLDGMVASSERVWTRVASDSSWRAQRLDTAHEGVGGQLPTPLEPVAVLGEYSPWRDGLAKNLLPSSVPIVYVGKQIVHMVVWMLCTAFITVVLWLASSRLLQRRYQAISAHDALVADALLHLPCVVYLAFLYLLQYDIRYDPAFPYQPRFIYLAVTSLMLFKGAMHVEAALRQHRVAQTHTPGLLAGTAAIARKGRMFAAGLCLLIIVVGGLMMRLPRLDATSLSHDETTMALLAQEVLQKGYPSMTIGPLEKPLTTYELLPYPIALSMKFLGSSPLAVRVPAVVFATATTCLIAYIGAQLWGVWTGLIAAAIYSFSPFSILWGTNAFHPQQTQFFALLTAYLFYQALNGQGHTIIDRYFYGASVCFSLAYLSWAGTGLLLPSLFICLVVTKGHDLSWLKCKALWLSLGIACTTVTLQMSRRILLNFPYIVVGKGLSDAGFALFFLDPMYDPWFYARNFLLTGNHLILTILTLFCLPLVLKEHKIRYFFILLSILLILLTNFVPNSSIRYIYFCMPFFVISSSAIITHSISFIRPFLHHRHALTVRIANGIIFIIIPVLIFLSTNAIVLHLYRLMNNPEWIIQMNPDIYWIDYKSTTAFLEKKLIDGDLIISTMPHTLKYYLHRKSNYYLQAYTDRQILYDVSGVSDVYLDKYVGGPVIRDISELRYVLDKSRRVWIIAMPDSTLLSTNDKVIVDYIVQNSKVVFESYKTRVYLWEK